MIALIRIKNKSKWLFSAKLILVIVAVWFVYLKVVHHEGTAGYFDQLILALDQPGTTLLFTCVLLLMILNWLLEAMKWKYMISKIERVTLGRALKAVFSGITVSFFTPNRIGEYAGRVFHLPYGKRMQATLITIIESSSQLLVTVLTGSVAAIFYMQQYLELSPWMFKLFQILFILLSVISLFLFFNLVYLESLFSRFIKTEYWKKIIHVFALYSRSELSRVFLLSICRYAVFSLQFYLLLILFGCYLPVWEGMLMISMTFFVMSVVPTFTLTEIGIRGAVAAYFFGQLTMDVFPVLNASFSLWFINLVLPALMGAGFIFSFRLGRNER